MSSASMQASSTSQPRPGGTGTTGRRTWHGHLPAVPAKSVCRFKCVSKAWRDLIAGNRNKLPQAMEGLFYRYMADDKIYESDGTMFSVICFSFVDLTARSVPPFIDPCFSFLTELPGIQVLLFLGSCNGLILFANLRYRYSETLGYIVCNPTTKQWQDVPTCDPHPMLNLTFLAFNPALSPHFQLVQFDADLKEEQFLAVHAYSSEMGTWSRNLVDEHGEQGQLEGWHHQVRPSFDSHCAFVNGILHLVVCHWDQRQQLILVVDVQGKARRMITVPWATRHVCYFGQSQGLLHCITQDEESYKMSIWVLQDYDRQEWVLKDSLSSLQLLVGKSCRDMPLSRFEVIDIHRDCNLVFFAPRFRQELIAYDMDSKEASVIATFGTKFASGFARYVPYFSESPALTNKQ